MGNKTGNRIISSRQMKCLLFVSLLSPIIRLFPKSSVNLGGETSWLSPVIALPAALLLYAMVRRFMKNAAPGEDLGDMILRAAGTIIGKVVLAIIALWLIFYTGFVVKGSAERLISSIYPNGQPGLFVITITIAAVWMAVQKLGGLGRMSEIFAPLIGVILFIIVVIAMFKIEAKNLLPVTHREIDNIALGAIPVVNVLGIGVYMGFLEGSAEKAKRSKIDVLLLLTATIIAIMVTTIGTLGAELIRSLQHSFFVMIRDIDLLGVVERVEAVVIVTWVITDLVFITALLKICGEITGTVFKKENKNIYIIFSAIISLVPAFLIIKNAFELHYLSGIIVPIINILVVFIILPLLFVVGRIRQKI